MASPVLDRSQTFRAQFPITERLAYLNHAAAGPVSLPVIEAVNTFLVDRAHRGSEAAADSKLLAERTRAKAAEFIGCSTEEVAFMKATPDGLNAVANGIDWKAGDEIVLPDIEFPANVYPWMNLQEFGVQLRWVRSENGCIATEDVLAAITERTRLVAMSWVEFHGGYRNDLATIGAECRKRGIYLAIDAIQGLGVLNCDVTELNVDFLCAASQKWMLAPHGIAIFYVRKAIMDQIRVAFVGMSGIDQDPSYLKYNLRLRSNASRFEPGYINQVGIAGLEAAIDLFNDVGREMVEARALTLAARLREGLIDRGYLIYGATDGHGVSTVVSFRHPRVPAGELVQGLASRQVIVSEREEHVRVAPHFYNSEDEVDLLLETLPSASAS
jgi:cysteine desulfurase / selenocysteine lyase